MMMNDDISPKLPARARGRPFEKGRSGNPGGRRRGSRNKATLAAAGLLAGESEASTRKAVEMALAGRPTELYPPRKLSQLGPVCHRLDRGERRRERRLRDRVRRKRRAVPLAHTRPGTFMTKPAIMKKLMTTIGNKQRAPAGPLRRGRARPPRPVRVSTNTRGFAADLLQV